MDITQIIIFSAGGFAVGAGLALALARFFMKKRGDSILKSAREEAENIKKEKIFQAKFNHQNIHLNPQNLLAH